MIRLPLGPEDLAEIRFGFSPLWECVFSVRVLGDPARHALHLPWVGGAREALEGLDLGPLEVLARSETGFVPDFVAPPPSSPLPALSVELERVRNTPPEVVRREVEQAYPGGAEHVPAARRYVEAPEAAVTELVDLIEVYWERVMAPHWPRLRTLLEGDVLHRARTLALEGPGALFGALGRQVRYREGVVEVAKEFEAEKAPGGRGLLLIPSVFVWPDVFVVIDEPWRPALMYPARGVGEVWPAARPSDSEALEALLGRGRARVLLELERPVTTGELAERLGTTPSAASQHLSRLSRARMVRRNRVGRRVFYTLSPEGRTLLQLFGGGVAS